MHLWLLYHLGRHHSMQGKSRGGPELCFGLLLLFFSLLILAALLHAF